MRVNWCILNTSRCADVSPKILHAVFISKLLLKALENYKMGKIAISQ